MEPSSGAVYTGFETPPLEVGPPTPRLSWAGAAALRRHTVAHGVFSGDGATTNRDQCL
jgi:hypothetical protein